MSGVGEFIDGLNAARGASRLAIDEPSSVGRAAVAEGGRLVLYASGDLVERGEDLAAARAWAEKQGFAVVDMFQDDLVNWLAWNREAVRDAVGVIAAGRADALGIPERTGATLSESDRDWLLMTLGQVGAGWSWRPEQELNCRRERAVSAG